MHFPPRHASYKSSPSCFSDLNTLVLFGADPEVYVYSASILILPCVV
jgi:hypothetical protein